jgi:hypothetical protein
LVVLRHVYPGVVVTAPVLNPREQVEIIAGVALLVE